MAEYQRYPSSVPPGTQPWDIFQLKKLKLYGTPWNPEDRTKCPTVQFYLVNGNPRFKLYMNDGGENKSYTFALNPLIASTFFIALMDVAANPEESRIGWRIKSMFPHIGQRTEKVQVISTITIGRDIEKVVYMAFQVKGLNVARFPFTADYYADMVGEDGEALGNSRASSLVARGWATEFLDMMHIYLVTRCKEPPPSQNAYKAAPPSTANTGWAAEDDVAF